MSTSGYHRNISVPIQNLYLNLENFEDAEVPEDCPFVLTSPRSLEACRRLRVKPVDLLPDKIDEARKEILNNGGELTYESLAILRDAESERREVLESCRDLRLKLIEEECFVKKDKSTVKGSPGITKEEIRTRKNNLFFDRCSLQSVLFDDGVSFVDDRPEADQGYGKPHEMFAYQNDDRNEEEEDEEDDEELDSLSVSGGVNRFSTSPPPTTPTIQPSLNKGNPKNFVKKGSKKRQKVNNQMKDLIIKEKVLEEDLRHRQKMRNKETEGSSKLLKPRSRSCHSKSTELLKGLEELSHHDRRILRLLALKRHNQYIQTKKAEEKHREWREERRTSVEEKKNNEIIWNNFVAKKRQAEAEHNEIRLIHAKKKLEESQNLMRALIKEKEQKAQNILQDPKRAEQYNEWIAGEEERRKTVEFALKELFDRDTKYRKGLASHLESHIRAVDARRTAIKFKEARSIAEANSEEYNDHKRRWESRENERRERMEYARQAIYHKDERISNFVDICNFRRQQNNHAKIRRHLRNEKIQNFKREMELSMDSWRRRVLEVQSESIARAEENVRKALEEKKAKFNKENARKTERQRKRLAEVQKVQNRRRDEYRETIERKQKRMESLHQQKNEEMTKSQNRARHTSDLRQVLLGSDIEEEYLDALISRILYCSVSTNSLPYE